MTSPSVQLGRGPNAPCERGRSRTIGAIGPFAYLPWEAEPRALRCATRLPRARLPAPRPSRPAVRPASGAPGGRAPGARCLLLLAPLAPPPGGPPGCLPSVRALRRAGPGGRPRRPQAHGSCAGARPFQPRDVLCLVSQLEDGHHRRGMGPGGAGVRGPLLAVSTRSGPPGIGVSHPYAPPGVHALVVPRVRSQVSGEQGSNPRNLTRLHHASNGRVSPCPAGACIRVSRATPGVFTRSH